MGRGPSGPGPASGPAALTGSDLAGWLGTNLEQDQLDQLVELLTDAISQWDSESDINEILEKILAEHPQLLNSATIKSLADAPSSPVTPSKYPGSTAELVYEEDDDDVGPQPPQVVSPQMYAEAVAAARAEATAAAAAASRHPAPRGAPAAQAAIQAYLARTGNPVQYPKLPPRPFAQHPKHSRSGHPAQAAAAAAAAAALAEYQLSMYPDPLTAAYHDPLQNPYLDYPYPDPTWDPTHAYQPHAGYPSDYSYPPHVAAQQYPYALALQQMSSPQAQTYPSYIPPHLLDPAHSHHAQASRDAAASVLANLGYASFSSHDYVAAQHAIAAATGAATGAARRGPRNPAPATAPWASHVAATAHAAAAIQAAAATHAAQVQVTHAAHAAHLAYGKGSAPPPVYDPNELTADDLYPEIFASEERGSKQRVRVPGTLPLSRIPANVRALLPKAQTSLLPWQRRRQCDHFITGCPYAPCRFAHMAVLCMDGLAGTCTVQACKYVHLLKTPDPTCTDDRLVRVKRGVIIPPDDILLPNPTGVNTTVKHTIEPAPVESLIAAGVPPELLKNLPKKIAFPTGRPAVALPKAATPVLGSEGTESPTPHGLPGSITPEPSRSANTPPPVRSESLPKVIEDLQGPQSSTGSDSFEITALIPAPDTATTESNVTFSAPTKKAVTDVTLTEGVTTQAF